MFAADAEFQARTRRAAARAADADEFANAVAVDRDEGIFFVDALLLVNLEEAGGVVARNAEGGLREIVGAE